MRRHSRPSAARTIVTAVVLAATSVSGWIMATPASAQESWAPADQATIHPGVQMHTDGAQCTANFIWTDGSEVYIGYAAHCAGTGAATETDGCEEGSLPLGTQVEIAGASRPGELAYSSWIEMQAVGETDENACAFNDFALVRIDPADHDSVNPSVPHWGGPDGVNTSDIPAGADVYSYGNSSLRLGLTAVAPKQGISLGTTGDGWSHQTFNLTPGIPGDSGSPLLDNAGQASGVLSTLTVAPIAGSNNFGDIASATDYMRAHNPAFADVELALGTEPFDSSQLPIGSLSL